MTGSTPVAPPELQNGYTVVVKVSSTTQVGRGVLTMLLLMDPKGAETISPALLNHQQPEASDASMDLCCLVVSDPDI